MIQVAAAPAGSSDGSTGCGPCHEPCSSTTAKPTPATKMQAGQSTATLAAKTTQHCGMLTVAPSSSELMDRRMQSPWLTQVQPSSLQLMPARARRMRTRAPLARAPARILAGGVGGCRGCRCARVLLWRRAPTAGRSIAYRSAGNCQLRPVLRASVNCSPYMHCQSSQQVSFCLPAWPQARHGVGSESTAYTHPDGNVEGCGLHSRGSALRRSAPKSGISGCCHAGAAGARHSDAVGGGVLRRQPALRDRPVREGLRAPPLGCGPAQAQEHRQVRRSRLTYVCPSAGFSEHRQEF